MLKKDKIGHQHLPVDNTVDSISEKIELPQDILTHTLDDYYRELQNFDPEDPGSVVHEESKHPMFSLKNNISYKKEV